MNKLAAPLQPSSESVPNFAWSYLYGTLAYSANRVSLHVTDNEQVPAVSARLHGVVGLVKETRRSQSLEFALGPVRVKETFEKVAVKEMILTKLHRELGMNKSTLWYQRKRLRETGSVRLYDKTRQYFG